MIFKASIFWYVVKYSMYMLIEICNASRCCAICFMMSRSAHNCHFQNMTSLEIENSVARVMENENEFGKQVTEK